MADQRSRWKAPVPICASSAAPHVTADQLLPHRAAVLSIGPAACGVVAFVAVIADPNNARAPGATAVSAIARDRLPLWRKAGKGVGDLFDVVLVVVEVKGESQVAVTSSGDHAALLQRR